MVSGTGGEIVGGAETATGVGAPVGAATIAVSTTMVVGGAANVLVGVQSLMAAPKGGADSGAPGAVTGPGAGSTQGSPKGSDATPAEKKAVRQENRDAHGGKLTCDNCKRDDLVDPQRARGGVRRPANEAQVDHIVPKAQGGQGRRPNLRVLCPECNKPGTIPR
ncbi:MAG: HNH endonuclease [Polyangiaceae bacterium]